MPPNYDFLNSKQIWQGPPKSGKTSTAAALKPAAEKIGIEGINPFFLIFEPGTGGVEITGTSEECGCGAKKSCEDCEGAGVKRKILQAQASPKPLSEIEEWFEWAGKSEYNPLVIDTTDAMYQQVSDAVCLGMGIRNPTQADHGTAWVQIYDTMRELIATLSEMDKALIFLMHVYYQEKRLKGGATITSASFNVSGKTKPYLAGLANQILHFEIIPGKEEDKHIITAKPTAGVEAGDHWGLFPDELDRGKSPEDGAEAILRCFYE